MGGFKQFKTEDFNGLCQVTILASHQGLQIQMNTIIKDGQVTNTFTATRDGESETFTFLHEAVSFVNYEI